VNLKSSGAGPLARTTLVRLAAALASVLVTVGAVWAATSAHADVTPPPGQMIQIDTGGTGDGTFVADTYFTGGATDGNHTGTNGNPNFPRTVTHPIPQTEWNTYRFLDSTYHVPGLLPATPYQVRLYFLDWYWTKVGKRVFNVDINGTPVLTNFDIIQTAVNAGADGNYTGVEQDFTATADGSGTITIDFLRGTADQALISAIVLVPAAP
jgi:hypothetical protein